MTEYLAPIMRMADASVAVAWYRRLGFVKEWGHRFEIGLPLYVGLARGDLRVHLSEHTGDVRPGTLVYIRVEDVAALAGTLGVTEIDDMPWGRDFEVADPDGNRLRIGTADVRRMTKVRSALSPNLVRRRRTPRSPPTPDHRERIRLGERACEDLPGKCGLGDETEDEVAPLTEGVVSPWSDLAVLQPLVDGEAHEEDE